MEKFKVSFEANNQQLKSIGTKHASDTYADIEATFTLGEKWTDMDSVSAVWWNDFTRIATVLDSQGKCIVPHEVLTRKGCVRVNLVGSIVEGDELITRLTSYSAEAVQVNEKIKLTGSETSELTPSQFEQFVAVVISEVEKVTGMTAQAETLPAGSQATARYENGILYLGIPQGIQGERGETGQDGADGNGIASVVYNADYTLTLVFDNGETFTTPPIRGERGERGEAGQDGADGRDGADGVTPNLTIGTVETLAPTEDATATITGTAEEPVLNLGLPKGDTGEVSLEDLGALLPTDTASGDIVTIPDGQSVIPAESLKVALEPIQSGSGTPSPDNIRPISGHTEVDAYVSGKNLLPSDAFSVDGYVKGDGSISAPNVTNIEKATDFLAIVSGTAYIFSVKIANADTKWIGIGIYDADKNFIKRVGGTKGTAETTTQVLSATDTENAKYVRISLRTFGLTIEDAQLELGSTATSYEPYEGSTYTTTLGRTVYGGTLDVVSGVLTVDRAMVDLGTLNWRYSGGFFRITNLTNLKRPINNSTATSALCTAYNALSWDAISRTDSGSFAISAGSDNPIFCNTNYTDATEFKESVTGQMLCYELATPQTYQLTPQEVRLLLGTNNVWSDGKVTLTYSADIQRYIEKKPNGNSTTLTMSRPMVQTEETETETETTETEETE